MGEVTNHQYMSLDQAQRLGMIVGAISIPGLATLIGNPMRVSWLLYAAAAAVLGVYAAFLPKGLVRNQEHSARVAVLLICLFLSAARFDS